MSPLSALAAAGLPLCPVAIALRTPCPGCGVTRATYAFLTFDFAKAIDYQPLAAFVCPVAVVLSVYHFGSYVRSGQFRWPWSESLIIAIGVALTIVWAVRSFGFLGGPVDV